MLTRKGENRNKFDERRQFEIKKAKKVQRVKYLQIKKGYGMLNKTF